MSDKDPTFAAPYGEGKAELGVKALATLKKLLQKDSGKIAAVVMEPLMQGAAGMLAAPAGFLYQVRQLCTKYFVADEKDVVLGAELADLVEEASGRG